MNYIDLHCDALTKREGVFHVTRKKLEAGGCLLQCFAAFIDPRKGEGFARAMALADHFDAMCAREGYAPVRAARDIGEGKIHAMLTVEGGGALEGSLEKLEALYRRGVRMLTLTWNLPNELGFPNSSRLPPLGELAPAERATEGVPFSGELSPEAAFPSRRPLEGELSTAAAFPPWRPLEGELAPAKRATEGVSLRHGTLQSRQRRFGLTSFGRAAVERMAELGMLVDVSHGSDDLLFDVAAALKRTHTPFVASHSGARAVFPHPRNLSDEGIRAVAESGGAIGLCFVPAFLTDDGTAERNREAILAHARHIVRVGGEDALALGSDFDGAPENPYLPDAAAMPRLYDDLCSIFPSHVAQKVVSGNALRVFQAIR